MRSLLLPRGQFTFEHLAVMGILNLTTDSFHAASRVSESELLRRAEAMLEEGASVCAKPFQKLFFLLTPTVPPQLIAP